MKKKLFLMFSCFIFSVHTIYAQDTIVLRKFGESDIRAKVTMVNTKIVKYKKIGDVAGTEYIIKTSKVAMIKYEDRSKDFVMINPEIEIIHVSSPLSNGTFRLLACDNTSVSFKAMVETPVYMVAMVSDNRTVIVENIKNTKGNILIDGVTATSDLSLRLGDSRNLRLPKDTEVKCSVEKNISAGFVPKAIMFLTDEKAAPMWYDIASKKWTDSIFMSSHYCDREHNIVELLENNIIEVEISGDDITSIDMKIRRFPFCTVNVQIPVGTLFVSKNTATQNMIATGDMKAHLTSYNWQKFRIPAVCVNRQKNISGNNDKFDIQRSPDQEELAQLMPALNKANTETKVKQAAVWIVTGNAGYKDLADNHKQTIDPQTVAKAMKICYDTDIDILKKNIWNDRKNISSLLTKDDELKKWLDSFDPLPNTAAVRFEQTTYYVHIGQIAKDNAGNITVKLFGKGIGNSGIIPDVNGKPIVPVGMKILAGDKITEYKDCKCDVIKDFCLYMFETKTSPTQIIVYGNDGTNRSTATFDAKTMKIIKK